MRQAVSTSCPPSLGSRQSPADTHRSCACGCCVALQCGVSHSAPAMGDSGGPTAASRAGAAVPIRAAKVSRGALIQGLRQRIDALERTGRHGASAPRSSSLSASCSVSLPRSGVGDADVPPDPRMSPRPPSASPTLSVSSVAVPPAFGARCATQDAPWTFGDAQIDAFLPGGALDSAALHEIKPRSYNDWSAVISERVRPLLNTKPTY